MCFFFSFLPATVWLVVGYVVLVSSTRAEGAMKTFGRGLATWIFIIAALFPVMGAYVTLTGLCPMADLIQSMLAG